MARNQQWEEELLHWIDREATDAEILMISPLGEKPEGVNMLHRLAWLPAPRPAYRHLLRPHLLCIMAVADKLMAYGAIDLRAGNGQTFLMMVCFVGN